MALSLRQRQEESNRQTAAGRFSRRELSMASVFRRTRTSLRTLRSMNNAVSTMPRAMRMTVAVISQNRFQAISAERWTLNQRLWKSCEAVGGMPPSALSRMAASCGQSLRTPIRMGKR